MKKNLRFVLVGIIGLVIVGVGLNWIFRNEDEGKQQKIASERAVSNEHVSGGCGSRKNEVVDILNFPKNPFNLGNVFVSAEKTACKDSAVKGGILLDARGKIGGRIKGKIVDEEGRGVKGVKVVFGFGDENVVYTDENGEFLSPIYVAGKKYTFSYIPDDPYYLPSWYGEEYDKRLEDMPYPKVNMVVAEIPEKPYGGVVETPEIKLKKGGVIRGKVYAADGKTVLREIDRVCVEGLKAGKDIYFMECTRGQVKAILGHLSRKLCLFIKSFHKHLS